MPRSHPAGRYVQRFIAEVVAEDRHPRTKDTLRELAEEDALLYLLAVAVAGGPLPISMVHRHGKPWYMLGIDPRPFETPRRATLPRVLQYVGGPAR